MAKEIPLGDIPDYLQESVRLVVAAATLEAEGRLKLATPVFSKSNYGGELDKLPNFFKVNGKTVPFKKSIDEHVGGRLRNSWQSDTPLPGDKNPKGSVTNNVEYAEPVIYGTALPPSWRGQFRTKQGTKPGFPDLIAKELETWAQGEFQKILRRA